MKSSTRLDSIAFQLTPTRTRCDLVISANGKTEKIASGLLEPFLAHMKAAQEQIGKGGYSIVLEPMRGSDTSWFTKGTVERFVRFVSTPEILERVYTIESEILQIEKAISLQSCNIIDFHNAVDLPIKSEENLEASKPALGSNEEKAIVLYQPANHQAEEDGSTIQEKNSKVQLVQVLETRKSVLQKEQGMAFARAVAASFDIDNIATLLLFAESFGASRMMDACKKFMHLWKAKHESGQWVDVESTEAMFCPADVPSTNATGIVFHNSNESAQGEAVSENNGRSDQCHPSQPYPMFAPWQMNPQANVVPPFQPYSMQGMPYYPNYPGNMFFQPPYPPADDSRSRSGQRIRRRRHSMDNGDISAESETQEAVQDDAYSDEEESITRRRRNKGGRSVKKQSGTVVIRNINYIASTKQGSGDSDSQSCSGSGTDDDGGHNNGDETRKSRQKGNSQMSDNRLKSSARDDGHWQAFENFLLTDADESSNSVNSMFAMEGKVQGRKRQTAIGDASSTLGRHSMGGSEDFGFSGRFDISGDTNCMRKRVDDPLLSYGQEANLRHGSLDGQADLHSGEAGIRRRAYRRPGDADIDYVFSQQDKLRGSADSPVDPVISNELQGSANENGRGSSHAMVDESFVVLHRTGSDQVAGYSRAAMDMEYQLPSVVQEADKHTVGTSQSNYEPNDLNLMPNRGMDNRQSGYDPAMDYEMEAQVKETTQQSGKIKTETLGTKQGPKKTVKDQKSKAERTPGSNRRDKPYKLSPSEDARARAEKLRAFKADLQKQKKEQEQEQLKRLEALKIERQKRIAARSGATVPQSPTPSHQSRKQLPKLSPISQRGSKFSDTEPGSSSPLQRSTLKLVPKVKSDSSKISKPGRLNNGNQSNGNRLTRSASSLSMRKEENNGPAPESKATIAGIRRLSEPKNSAHHIASGKTRSAEAVSRHRVAEKGVVKKMPAALETNNAKSASLPEHKLRASKGSSVSIQKKTTNKEKSEKPEKIISTASVSSNMSTGISPPPRDGDDNTIVEKTVVMLECEKPTTPVFCQPEDETSVHDIQLATNKDQCGKSEEDASIPPPASPINVKEIGCEPSSREVKEHAYTCAKKSEELSPNSANVDTIEKPYQAPYARVSSVEDSCMANSEYGKAPPTNFSTAVASVENTTVLVSDNQRQDLVKLSQTASGKSQGKDSSKGFKRLLKFGKRSSGASQSSIDLDKASLDGSASGDNALNGSSEAFTLKNLLTQEESSSAGATPKKSSRSFSLLSPFKSKNTEKKSAT